MVAPEQWWRDAVAARRFVTDLVRGELATLRPGAELPAYPWADALSLTATGLGCDSLELLALASAVAEAVHMHRSGIEDVLLARRTVGDWTGIVAASLERFCTEITFRSSGSTGRPTPTPHQLSALIEEIRELAGCFPGRRRLLCAVPAHHIYGFLFSVLLPVHLGIPVLDIRDTSPAGLAGDLRAGDLIVGHPAFWTAFARSVPDVPPGVLGVTSTAPCPATVATAVVDQGLQRLVQVYGSSETSGIGWRDEPDGRYELLSFWQRTTDGCSLVRTQAGASAVSCQAPDRLVWDGERHFQVSGRCDGAVQVGGINVFPTAIASRLCEHPAVAQAAVRAMRPEEGARLKAFIVTRAAHPDTTRVTAELTEWCDTHLTPAERPKAFTFGSAIPRGQLDKRADWALPVHGEALAAS